MKIFPSKELKFELIGDHIEALNRLKRRTEKSKNLTSSYTDKSFRGVINGNEFKIISSTIGKGAFCVMSGEIESKYGKVKIEIHKGFRILLSIFLCLPIIGMICLILTNAQEFSLTLFLVITVQILMIRFVFIELVFKNLSKESLNRLRDVIDFEWIN